MTKRKYWTDEENKVLVQAIEAYPQNISKAFREVSKDLNRTEAACRVHWYKVLAPSKDPSRLKVSFMVVSPIPSFCHVILLCFLFLFILCIQ